MHFSPPLRLARGAFGSLLTTYCVGSTTSKPSRPSDSPGALVRAFSLAIAAAAAAVNELGGGAAAGPPKAPWWGGAPKGCAAAAAPPNSGAPSGAGGGRQVVRSGSA